MKLPTVYATLKNVAPDRNGEVPIIINVTFERKVIPKSTGLKCLPADFDKFNLVKKGHRKNGILKEKIRDLNNEFLKAAEIQPLTIGIIKDIMAGDAVSRDLFSVIAEKVLKMEKGILSEVTLKHLKSEISKINTFAPDCRIGQMDANFFKGYERDMRLVRKNQQNTIHKSLTKISTILTKAFEAKLINTDISANIKPPKYINPERITLTQDETEKIEKYADNGAVEALRNVAAWFILQLYSGVRYGDLVKWDEKSRIRNDKFLIYDEKTKTQHYVPLYPKLVAAIERVRGIDPIPTNQICNRYLKEIAVFLDIGTHVTTHTARHTFAVNYLNAGGSIEVLSKLLGHSSIKTTSIYGRISNKRIDEETAKVLL